MPNEHNKILSRVWDTKTKIKSKKQRLDVVYKSVQSERTIIEII